MIRRPPGSTLFPSTPLFRSDVEDAAVVAGLGEQLPAPLRAVRRPPRRRRVHEVVPEAVRGDLPAVDRKSTRLNSSHANISYAVFCLKKKKRGDTRTLAEKTL